MNASILLAIALSGLTQVRGVYRERFYTGACDREGVPLWEDRPVAGKQLFLRVAGESAAPALAQAVTGDGGKFAMSFQPPTSGDYCVAHQGKDRLVCLSGFSATPIEGSAWMSVVLGPVNARPQCVSQRRSVRGQTRFVEEPCGDAGKPPRPLGGKRIWIHALDAREPDVGVESDAAGRFEARLFPGRYCAGAAPRPAKPGQPPDGCGAPFEVAGRDVDGVTVDFRRTCGDPGAFQRPVAEPLPPGARGVGRVVALGGTIHVRGEIVHQTTYWGGAYRREPPPAVTAGSVLRVRRGDSNGPRPLVAEVVTDEYGFDLALPPGVWCLETAYHDEWFKGWASAGADLDRSCMKERYEACDHVVRLDALDVEGVRIRTTQWHPPTQPCRVRPYAGPSPP